MRSKSHSTSLQRMSDFLVALLLVVLGLGLLATAQTNERRWLPIGVFAYAGLRLAQGFGRKADPTKRTTSDSAKSWTSVVLPLVMAAAWGIFLYLVFVVAPIERQMGIVQKIFYIHVPSAYAMYLGFVLCAGFSARFLYKPSAFTRAFSKAAGEVGLLFATVVLVTGPLWAYKAWGTAWTWDPQLTITLLVAMIYAAFVLLRSDADAGITTERFAAGLAVMGMLLLPLIHYSVQLWRGQHPVVVMRRGGGISPDMRPAFLMGFLLMTVILTALIVMRGRQLRLADRLRNLERDVDDLVQEQAELVAGSKV